MGFGGGGGGFTPSPNNVPGSTQTGTDKDTDTHQFTGSVDITGSLTLNGSSVTGGGGGGTPGGATTQVQYNNAGAFAGSANFTFDGDTITVSDDSNITANIGKATVGNGGLPNAAVFAHRDFNNVNSYAFRQRATTGQTDINAANGQPISFQQNGSTQAVLDASAQFGIGNGIVPAAVLHVSSSAGSDLFKVEHTDSSDNPIFVITGSNGGRIGILTDAPGAVLDIHPQNSAGNNEVKIRGSAAVSHFYTTVGEDTFIRGGTQSSHVVLADVRNTTGTNNQKLSIGDAGNATTAKMHLSSSDTPTVMAVTSDSGSILTALENQRVGIGTATPTQVLDVVGTANATTLSIGGTAITSTAAELNLLDASTVTAPSEGIWTGVERVAVINIGASEYTAAPHVLGVTLPDNAIITRAAMDVFQGLAGGTTFVSLTTTGTVYPAAAPSQIDFFLGFGGGAQAIAGFSAEQGIPLTIAGGKLNGASTLTFTVAGDPLTAGGINVYVYYIMGT